MESATIAFLSWEGEFLAAPAINEIRIAPSNAAAVSIIALLRFSDYWIDELQYNHSKVKCKLTDIHSK